MRKKLSTYIWEYKWHYLFAIIALIISVSLDMLSPMLTMHIIDDVIVGRRIDITALAIGRNPDGRRWKMYIPIL